MTRRLPHFRLRAVRIARTLALVGVLAVIAGVVGPLAIAASFQRDGATDVSIRQRNITVNQAYDELTRQTKYQFRSNWGTPSGKLPLSLNVIHEPFWEAVLRISKTSKMECETVRRDTGMEVWLVPDSYQRGRKTLGHSVNGLLMATVYETAEDQVLRAKTDPTKKFANVLSIAVHTEPKVKGLIWYSLNVDELSDEYGRPIECKGVGTGVYAAFSDGTATIRLQLPERAFPRKIGRLRLSGKVMAAVKSEVAEVSQLSVDTPPAVVAAGFRIETEAAQGKDGRIISVTMTRVGNDSPGWLRPNIRRALLLEPVIMDSRGKRFATVMREYDWFGKTFHMRLEAMAPGNLPNEKPTGAVDKMTMEIPTDVVEYDAKFEFSDLALH